MLRTYLPALARALFFALSPTSGNLQLDKDSFLTPAQLEFLWLSHFNVTTTPDCFTRLPALATLELFECGLSSIPAALTALAGSLTSLVLANNDDLQLRHDDVNILLALGKLRKLDLRKIEWAQPVEAGNPAAGYMGRPYDASCWLRSSLQRVVELLTGFHQQHGHALAIELHRDTVPEASEEEA